MTAGSAPAKRRYLLRPPSSAAVPAPIAAGNPSVRPEVSRVARRTYSRKHCSPKMLRLPVIPARGRIMRCSIRPVIELTKFPESINRFPSFSSSEHKSHMSVLRKFAFRGQSTSAFPASPLRFRTASERPFSSKKVFDPSHLRYRLPPKKNNGQPPSFSVPWGSFSFIYFFFLLLGPYLKRQKRPSSTWTR